MKNLMLSFTLLLLLAGYVSAETAPVAWDRYRLADKKVSVLLPKLPTADEYVNYCNETKSVTYNAYAEGVAYQVSLVRKFSDNSMILGCREQTTFGPRALDFRLDAIRERKDDPEENISTWNGFQVYKFTTDSSIRWIISDITKGKRWIELSAVHYPDAKPNLERFLNSLDLNATPGKDIGEGSRVILGDTTVSQADKEANADVTSHFIIVFRPFPKYKNLFSEKSAGTVKLKVILRADGSIGTITRLEEPRPNTGDEAVAAAKRIVFLPARVDGVPVDAEMTLQYSLEVNRP